MLSAFLTPEFLTLTASSLTGFLFKFWAEKRQDQKELYDRMIGASKRSDESADAAVKRVPLDAGKQVRRVIVLCVLFGTILAPFILPFFGVPTVVELTEKEGSFLKVNGTEQHGNVPTENPVITKSKEGVQHTSSNFWLYYIPALGLISFITYKTFHTPKNITENKNSE